MVKELVLLIFHLSRLLFGLIVADRLIAVGVLHVLEVFNKFIVVSGEVIFPKLTEHGLQLTA